MRTIYLRAATRPLLQGLAGQGEGAGNSHLVSSVDVQQF